MSNFVKKISNNQTSIFTVLVWYTVVPTGTGTVKVANKVPLQRPYLRPKLGWINVRVQVWCWVDFPFLDVPWFSCKYTTAS
jgi:hypothetical protein